MSFWGRSILNVLAVAVGLALSGCSSSDQGQPDEEKEPHFVLGKSRVNAMDYQGAVEAFDESLGANPHSAAAHFELGWLYDEKISDPAAAIYHYQEYLKFYPKADNADVIRQRIYRCKQQLAADVLPLPSSPAAQQQLEKLADQNRQLQEEVDKWRAYYTSQRTNSTPQNNFAPVPASNPVPSSPTFSTQTQTATANHSGNSGAQTSVPRTHAVGAGETEASIARKFGVKLSALQAANPGVNPNRLHVGQVLNLPPP